MARVTIDDIASDPRAFLGRAEAGETILVTRVDDVIAEIRPVNAKVPKGSPRPFGLAKGEFVVPDDFDAPLPDDILDAFEGR